MKEIQAILSAYDRLQSIEAHRIALATVVYVEGSSYRRAGARMLVAENGEFFGGISGGCLEGDALRRAKQALIQSKPSVVRYDTREDDAHQIGVGLGCNGVIDVLISPLHRDDPHNPMVVLRSCHADRKPNVLATITEVKGPVPNLQIGQMFRYAEETAPGTGLSPQIAKDVRQVFQDRKSTLVTYAAEEGSFTCFLEFLPPVMHLILQGGNYDIFPLLRIGKELGWKLTIVAPAKKLNKEAFELADAIVPEKTGPVETDDYTATVLMSHDYRTDLENLHKMLQTDIAYIAMLGPRKRTEKILAELQSEYGKVVQPEALQRIYSPAGLDIGALSPEEIALAIVAEITAAFAGRDGRFLRERTGPIH
jgi:xanthine dehydrogenase accessory factor